ncbi:histidinol-phosphatase HisJ family protein [Enterococcus sp. AZ109]|uniref:histidinol-phosphatase HisJ family protein n=1 Tax=Enterococcus sp. AZ109 TaxID=2774634 RepID=UPI003F26ECA2
MRCDYHVHTYYSDDSDYPMEQVVKDAIQQGISELCFTDHVDYGVKLDHHEAGADDPANRLNVDYPAYYKEFTKLKEQYQQEISLRFGLEFGIQTGTIPKFEKLFSAYPFDFILLSIHQVNNQEFWLGDFQQGKTEEECYQEYYQELLAVVKSYLLYSCLAHLDLIRRYVDKEVNTFEANKEILTEILSYIIAAGKGIEVNTSSVRYQIPDTTPSKDILRLYRQLGGEIITIGSDSHKPDELGAHIEESRKMLKELGFQNYCTFQQMKPVFHPL